MTKENNVFIQNIYYMLAYAFQNLREDEEKKIVAEPFENIHDLFACILANGISLQLKRGLYRDYVPCRDDLSVMHGKIDIARTMRNFSGGRRLLTCEFDDFSEDNRMNQILKLCALLLLKCPDVKQKYRDALKKNLLFFSGIGDILPAEIRWSELHFHRNNLNYRTLMAICRLLLEGMLLTTDSGDMKLVSFLDDQHMCDLYEKFLLEYYRREHPELNARDARIYWALDDDVKTFLPGMHSDVMLENPENSKVLIIDAKYYSHTLTWTSSGRRTVSSDNLYQIFTYVKNEQEGRNKSVGKPVEVAGMLLYARADEKQYPDTTYRMSGNRISVKTLDLNQKFEEIRRQLDEIAVLE